AESAIPPAAAARHSQDSCLVQGCVPRGLQPQQNWTGESKQQPSTHERAMNSRQLEELAPDSLWLRRNPLSAPCSWQAPAGSARAWDQAIKSFPSSIVRRPPSPGDRPANPGCNSPQDFPAPDGTPRRHAFGLPPARSLAAPRQLCRAPSATSPRVPEGLVEQQLLMSLNLVSERCMPARSHYH